MQQVFTGYARYRVEHDAPAPEQWKPYLSYKLPAKVSALSVPFGQMLEA